MYDYLCIFYLKIILVYCKYLVVIKRVLFCVFYFGFYLIRVKVILIFYFLQCRDVFIKFYVFYSFRIGVVIIVVEVSLFFWFIQIFKRCFSNCFIYQNFGLYFLESIQVFGYYDKGYMEFVVRILYFYIYLSVF